MKRHPMGIHFLLAFLLVLGCAASPTAPRPSSPGGGKVELKVVSDRGNPAEMGERQWAWRNEVGAFMENDLVAQLRRAGYDAEYLRSEKEFQPRADRYLIKVSIKSYNPGSSAARILVGFGAGACSLDNAYELYGMGPEPIMTWTDGVGTSEHWSKLPRKLNSNAVKRITQKLGESSPK